MSTSSKPDNVRVIQFTSKETQPFSKCSEIDARMVNCNEIPWFVYIPDYECGTAETCDLADKGEAGTQANYQPKSFVFNSDMQQLLTIKQWQSLPCSFHCP